MNERFIILQEKMLNNETTTEEKNEFEELLHSNQNLKEEFEQQKRIKEVLKKMTLKNPSTEIWDNYWVNIYNRVERGIAWIIITIGALILFGFASITAIEKFLEDTQSPFILKIGVAAVIFGAFMLFFSIIREKYFTKKHDKYREIQR